MTDENLIEKAAKAIWEESTDPGRKGYWEDESEYVADEYANQARAALAVFREHTAPADDDRARIEQSNEVANIVFDEVKRAWPDLHPVLNLRYGIADALWDAGFRRGAPAEPARQDFMPGVIEALDNLTIRKGE